MDDLLNQSERARWNFHVNCHAFNLLLHFFPKPFTPKSEMSPRAKKVNQKSSTRKTRKSHEIATYDSARTGSGMIPREPHGPHKNWAKFTRWVRSELGLGIYEMAERSGVSPQWLKKAINGESISGEFRREFEGSVCELWKNFCPEREQLQFPNWEDNTPELAHLALSPEVKAIKQELNALTNVQFRLPQAFRAGAFFDQQPYPFPQEASDLGLVKFLDGSVRRGNSFREAVAALNQNFGLRTGGIFQVGHFLNLFAKAGYGDGIPPDFPVFRQTLNEIHFCDELIQSFDSYFYKWHESRGLPPASRMYFVMFSGYLQHTLDGTGQREPFRTVLEKTRIMLIKAPAKYGSEENSSELACLWQELKDALDSVNYRRGFKGE